MESVAKGVQKWLKIREVPTGIYCSNHPQIELVRHLHPPSSDYDPLIHGELTENGLQLSSNRYCSQCALDGIYQQKLEQKSEREANVNYLKNSKYGKYKVLKSQSIIAKKSLWYARFNTFKINSLEEKYVFNQARRIAQDYIEGGKFNTVFIGGAGRGKSHLAMAILHEVNEAKKDQKFSTLFVNISELVRTIKFSWNYDDKKTVEEQLTNLMRNVDLLVIDDLGTESTFAKDNSWIQGVIYNIYEARENNTIITSNFTNKEIKAAYNDKIISRIMDNSKNNVVKFDGITDKRKIS